ncbi:uncharacterized protein si:dkey-237j10.2 [Acanthochromis polyacanthus]|uniref:uncharacterized protein si:dkey-237j10.2 n=1 Tax=Acanthochromis polyacanthus TaxID=80966 RepID=UPI000B9008D6|nr:uncharacterized protein si:dkey-237j10.2 [Acanthochromis polyacanthus]
MLAEGFLRVLRYREERRFASSNKQKKRQINPYSTDSVLTDSTDLQRVSAQTGQSQEELDSTQTQMLRGCVGLSIPGSSPISTLHPVCIEDCSLLEQYPDLQVADSGRISHNPPRTSVIQHDLYIHSSVSEVGLLSQPPALQEKPGDALSSMSDQGYLVMGASVNISLDLPGSGLEPMSNSVLNGLLEKQLEEVYMQHLTDNLARCNSHLGNSLLHGLVPPPPPNRPPRGPDSLEASLEENSEVSRNKISYLSTQNLVPCSSNFSSPVLRISESDNPHLQ